MDSPPVDKNKKASENSLARKLDAFRWQQLRAKHGLAGSFVRLIKENVINSIYGIRIKYAGRKETENKQTDILLLQSSPKVILLQRKHLLKNLIIKKGYTLTEASLDKPENIIAEKKLLPPKEKTPLRYLLYAAHAEWITENFSPKILINDRNGSLYTPFLRAALKRKKSHLVHLAHATTLEASQRLNMNDYDYYFLFGESSLLALKERKMLFGSSMVALTGSHMIDNKFKLKKPSKTEQSILVIGVGPDKEKEKGYLSSYKLIKDWAARHPEFKINIKIHPRSKAIFWNDAASKSDNICVLPNDFNLDLALSESSMVINIMSNAVIEAALSGRPIITCNSSGENDIFLQEKFFGPPATCLEELDARINSIQENFDEEIKTAKKFSEFHLSHGFDGLNTTMEALIAIMNGSEMDKAVHTEYLTSAR